MPRVRLAGRPATLLGIVVAFVGGVAAGIQARVNGGLGSRLHDGIAAAILSNASAATLAVLISLMLPSGRAGLRRLGASLRTGRIRAWEYLGGIFGAAFVASQGLSVGALGVAVFTVAAVAGQSGSGLLVDLSGIGPGGRRAVTGWRVLGALLAVVAVLVAVEGQLRTPGRLVFAILPLVAGAGIAWQAAINGRLREAGGVLPVTFVNATVGTVALLLAFAVSVYVRGWPAGAAPREPWLYVGGPLGIVVIASSVIVVRQIGVLLLALGFVAGQVVGALGADLVAPGSAGPPGRATILSAALTLLAVLIAAYRSAGPPRVVPPALTPPVEKPADPPVEEPQRRIVIRHPYPL